MIVVQLQGQFYAFDTYCETLKQFMQRNGFKRRDIKYWWRKE